MSLNVTKATELKHEIATFLIYANPGMGKTYALGYLPGKTLVIDVDGSSSSLRKHPNAENIDILKINSSNIWDEWVALVSDVVKNSEAYEKYDNVAVDNISELFRSALADLGKKGKNEGVPNQGDYQKSDFILLRSLRAFNNLKTRIVFTAWETTDQYTSPDGQSFTRAMPDIRGKILNNFLGLVDVAARLVVHKDEEDNERRGFILQPSNNVYAKNRLSDARGAKVEELFLRTVGADNPAGDADVPTS